MANLYYREELADGELRPGALVEVTGDEARHAVRVSRLRQGERILVGDGAGTLGEGIAEHVAKDRFAVRIDRVESVPAPSQRLVLVQALAKGDRDERAVEQATEFGVDDIVPWQAARSVSRWDGAGGAEKAAKGVAKWTRIAREASKQSLRARVPGVTDPATLSDLCELASRPDAEVVALHPRGGRRLVEWAAGDSARLAERIVLVVGPEGGFADEELDALEAAGAVVRVLGETVLRTSSAGPAAIAVLNAALGRW
ncbi:16S rRNA (uracil(1498)-N(3))-methyltransferase [Leucobacter tenebrionis]|uniref:16S rRNA (uracil(1498)-N(3))-methyltransferase n=1 Tax=Leucobacter tenebrionis TaxID=2873270 RepID=UPI001CA745A2|nr:16S rRNA (uracil(1498)-N(3))-methyltransferase [Leucobacter tenebrionis]QZY52229.1 16S rRNA (uracil(1498)-N(3))-methyltransferase [Leucobacter tenebrionis]